MPRRIVAIGGSVVAIAIAAGVLLGPVGLLRPTSPLPPSPAPASPRADGPSAWPEAARGLWLADLDAGSIPGRPGQRVGLSIDDARATLVTRDGGEVLARSVATSAAAGSVAVRAEPGSSLCGPGDSGSYRLAASPEGLSLALEPIDDACASRATVLARTWVRSLEGGRAGGHGFLGTFDPAVELALPDGPFSVSQVRDVAEADYPDGRWLTVVRNPRGSTTPCRFEGGDPQSIPPTADAFAAYLGTIPGYTVDAAVRTIDGHRALRLDVVSERSGPCQETVNEFRTGETSVEQGWSRPVGGSHVLWVVEVGGDAFLFDWEGPRATAAETTAILSTVRFHAHLPTRL
jgi:hypothetical protein